MDVCKHSMGVENKNALDISEDDSDSTWKNVDTSTHLLDSAIEEARHKQETLVSTMELVFSLEKEVECEESALKQAIKEVARSSLDFLATKDQLTKRQHYAEKTNAMYAREVCAQRSILATKEKELQSQVSSLLDDEDTLVKDLCKMENALRKRLDSALAKKDLAYKIKIEKESSSREAIAFHEEWMDALVLERKRLKQEAIRNSKLQEFLIERHHAVDQLREAVYKTLEWMHTLQESSL